MDRDDVIYGPQVVFLKGKYVHKHSEHVENTPRVPLTLPIEKEYRNISLLMDSIFINGQPYLITKSAKINLHYIQSCMVRGKV